MASCISKMKDLSSDSLELCSIQTLIRRSRKRHDRISPITDKQSLQALLPKNDQLFPAAERSRFWLAELLHKCVKCGHGLVSLLLLGRHLLPIIRQNTTHLRWRRDDYRHIPDSTTPCQNNEQPVLLLLALSTKSVLEGASISLLYVCVHRGCACV